MKTGAFYGANLGVRLLVELAYLAALAYWGFTFHGGWASRAALGIGAPLVVGVVWAFFMAPRARWSLKGAAYHVIDFAIFAAAAAALFISGAHIPAVVFAAVYVLNKVLLAVSTKSAEPSP